MKIILEKLNILIQINYMDNNYIKKGKTLIICIKSNITKHVSNNICYFLLTI